MDDKKSFKLKEIADRNGFKHRDITHLHQVGAVSDLVHPSAYGDMLIDDTQKWTRLHAEEAIALCFAATFYRNFRLVEPSISAARQALITLPLIFFEPDIGFRILPSLIIFDQYPINRISGKCCEFFNTEKMVAEIPEHASEIEIRVGSRFFHLLTKGNPGDTHKPFGFYPTTDLFFQFLKNLNLELTDIDPGVLWEIVTPGFNYHGRTRLEFQSEFYRFAVQDMEKVMDYLGDSSHEE